MPRTNPEIQLLVPQLTTYIAGWSSDSFNRYTKTMQAFINMLSDQNNATPRPPRPHGLITSVKRKLRFTCHHNQPIHHRVKLKELLDVGILIWNPPQTVLRAVNPNHIFLHKTKASQMNNTFRTLAVAIHRIAQPEGNRWAAWKRSTIALPESNQASRREPS
ncbi:hypothetical protein PGTUg99_036294 [Puccinia graminis f. sp. tritici]|uniref:Uncharacterized protein n=1 Tax=Puccinia graminis f. sp. tritici TaxID=56615 RepID=A0A5B0R922_PUCGR|nr:hypothetical protein PGTUg99_036294 [Puccinia graminis f. sp. tritici]